MWQAIIPSRAGTVIVENPNGQSFLVLPNKICKLIGRRGKHDPANGLPEMGIRS